MMLWLAERGAETRSIADERTSRSCAELEEAQAEAGPLMLMVRRANMALSIAAGRRIRKALNPILNPILAPIAPPFRVSETRPARRRARRGRGPCRRSSGAPAPAPNQISVPRG